MSKIDVIGLPVPEALEILAGQGIQAAVEYTKPPFPEVDTAGRTLRVVAMRGTTLMAAYFQDGEPKEKDAECK
ncbi:MAG: hypothetical protein PHP02_01320 [Eubacteriales bacterium]|nr:hypothetical protein [Eubacteriales bacterium]